jgi:hypothetical protein
MCTTTTSKCKKIKRNARGANKQTWRHPSRPKMHTSEANSLDTCGYHMKYILKAPKTFEFYKNDHITKRKK